MLAFKFRIEKEKRVQFSMGSQERKQKEEIKKGSEWRDCRRERRRRGAFKLNIIVSQTLKVKGRAVLGMRHHFEKKEGNIGKCRETELSCLFLFMCVSVCVCFLGFGEVEMTGISSKVRDTEERKHYSFVVSILR